MTASITYTGDLRCECIHVQSGTSIETDAPTDNHGKGQRFSPTDTICVGLGTCIITTIAIKSSDKKFNFSGTTLEVTKHMLNNPRRIGKIEVILNFPAGHGVSDQDQAMVEDIGNNCPVMKSLHPDIEKVIKYSW